MVWVGFWAFGAVDWVEIPRQVRNDKRNFCSYYIECDPEMGLGWQKEIIYSIYKEYENY